MCMKSESYQVNNAAKLPWNQAMYKRKKTMGSLPENNVSSNIDFMSKIHQNDHHTFGFNIPFDPGNPGYTHLRFLALFLLISIGYAILWRGK